MATQFAVATLVSHLAGAAALGYAEAARVLSQPPYVLSTGLSAVLGPRSVQAAQERHRGTARHVSMIFAGLLLATGLPYLALVGLPWNGNPVARLVPNAYAIKWLFAATLVATTANSIILPQQFQLMGARKEAYLARVEALGNGVRVALAATAGVLGSFALPVGLFALAVVRWVGYLKALLSHYAVTDQVEQQPEIFDVDARAESVGRLRSEPTASPVSRTP
jgi:O-antigen/teichoic acid export membrane protein